MHKSNEKNKKYLQYYFHSSESLGSTLKAFFQVNYEASYIKEGFYQFYHNPGSQVVLVAHLDTIHQELPTKIFQGAGNTFSAKEGIGADDRNGVIATVELFRRSVDSGKPVPSIIFTYGEELGGIGVRKLAEDRELVGLLKQKHLFIEFDRRGAHDFVTYNNKNKELYQVLTDVGFKEARGSYTDIVTLADATGVMGVNISAGYYNAHTKQELSNFDELFFNIDRIETLLPVFEHNQYFIEEPVADIDSTADLVRIAYAEAFENYITMQSMHGIEHSISIEAITGLYPDYIDEYEEIEYLLEYAKDVDVLAVNKQPIIEHEYEQMELI
ncbi:M28 family peptidase [Culicoidibacter larvae]|uniref:M28 family peptidase n=1 Tax=Culicoidibacter larvae TaxID=2579976 RepID=A0A5R8Q7Z5_9FIRM|nr:M28 family peptidase [Culicoidibacter larvae]TLG71177.1 M28 family peptidase [Culicoidibacter larvae]